MGFGRGGAHCAAHGCPRNLGLSPVSFLQLVLSFYNKNGPNSGPPKKHVFFRPQNRPQFFFPGELRPQGRKKHVFFAPLVVEQAWILYPSGRTPW